MTRQRGAIRRTDVGARRGDDRRGWADDFALALVLGAGNLRRMEPVWRNRWIIGWAIVLAVVGACQIASGTIIWPVLFCIAAGVFTLNRVQSVPVGAIVCGLVLAGYMVGNRGFAQLSVAGSVPILPAEVALLCGGATVLIWSISERKPPVENDPLNWAVLGWMAIGTVRLGFDLRHGFLAVRDYAMVYYAAFFFIAQALAKNEKARAFLKRSVYIGGALLLLVQPFYFFFPDFFLQTLVVRGTPLVYYKGDLLIINLAVVSLVYFQLYEAKGKIWALLVCLGALGPVLYTNNRASRLGLVAGTLFLLLGRRYRFFRTQVAVAVVGAIGLLCWAGIKGQSWKSTMLYDVYEQVVSLADFSGTSSYHGETTFNKGDNNAFRTVWWRELLKETMETNPWVGLGFGHDLAQGFLDRYYPTSDFDFNVRSPHNILITVFARMGMVGLVAFVSVIALMLWNAWKAVRLPREETWPAAVSGSCIMLFVCACFGVVLEGPMGAMLFWVMLGLGNRPLQADVPQQLDEGAQTVAPEPHRRIAM